MRFYIPPNMNKDFIDAVNSDLGTEFVINFDSNNTVKAITPELDYRAKQTGITGIKPFHAEPNKLKIGDYIQDDSGVFIVSYLKNLKHPLCSEVQVQICNTKLTISRFQKEVVDGNGSIITPDGNVVIASNIYSVTMTEGYEFRTSSGSVGVVPTNMIASEMQYNNSTKNIKIADTFSYFNSNYRVENIDYSQVDINGVYGSMIIFAKKIQ